MALNSRSLVAPKRGSLGEANLILVARARQHSVRDFPGPLSIKHVVDGRVAWKSGRQERWVDESSFLLLNDGEPYSMDIDGDTETETCVVFFKHGFVESAARALSSPDLHLLDDPFREPLPLGFISRLHRRDQCVIPRLAAVRDAALAGACEMEMEDAFLTLANGLLRVHQETLHRLRGIPAARLSTRTELLRRVERAREYLHAQAGGPVTLAAAAQAACLSPFHLHRVFTRVFGQTPHSYLSALRLERAAALLKKGVPVTSACLSAGFESLGSFSSLFRKRFGCPPSALHPKFRKIREAADRAPV
jgi:AraC-like DNA-binding protein